MNLSNMMLAKEPRHKKAQHLITFKVQTKLIDAVRSQNSGYLW